MITVTGPWKPYRAYVGVGAPVRDGGLLELERRVRLAVPAPAQHRGEGRRVHVSAPRGQRERLAAQGLQQRCLRRHQSRVRHPLRVSHAPLGLDKRDCPSDEGSRSSRGVVREGNPLDIVIAPVPLLNQRHAGSVAVHCEEAASSLQVPCRCGGMKVQVVPCERMYQYNHREGQRRRTVVT